MVIGFSGFKGSGKNEAANALASRGYRIVGFADALKAEVTTRLRRTCVEIAKLHYIPTITRDASDATLCALLLQDKPPAFRRLLQEYGTEVRRADNEHYWVRQLETRIALTMYRERNFAICDVRFPNEAKMIWEYEGKLIRITRPGLQSDGHASEPTDLGEDATIVNDGTVDSLHSAVLAQVSHWESLAHSRRR